jgi:Na+-transporting methylmalonyl-CoA/oxaloacetate decarboxylase gamma subunit
MMMMMMMMMKVPVSFLLLLLLVTSFRSVVEAQFVVPEQPPMSTSNSSSTISISRPVEPDVVAVNYTDNNGVALQGFLATPDVADSGNPVPAIVIIP